MKNPMLSDKHLEINQAASSIFTIVAVCSVIVVFSLMASRALLQQRSYQNRVIAKKKTALNQLKANNAAVEPLVNSYKAFIAAPENVIGGSTGGSGDRDGDNAKIILDALPSKYDFPALTSSLEKILGKYTINNITGTDDEVNQLQASGDFQTPVDMPFELNVTGNYSSIQDLIGILERSIRPFSIQALNFIGADDDLTVTITAKTFYQPGRTLDIKKEVVE